MRRLLEISASALRGVAIGAALAAQAAIAAPFDVLDSVQDASLLNTARAVAVSPDGKHVYVCAFLPGVLAAYAVDGTTGLLTPAGIAEDGEGSVTGLAGCSDLAVSSDGRHVYAAGFNADGVAIFARDAGTGALAFVEALFDFMLESSAIDGPSGIVLSPDGAFVYVTAGIGSTLAAFARDADTGALEIADLHTSAPPNELLTGPGDLAISPDGSLVYVVTAGEVTPGVFADALLTFERNATTGALERIDAEQDGVSGVSGLTFPNVAAVSPDGRHVYVTAGSSDSIAIFERDAEDDSTGFVGAVTDTDPGFDGLDAPVGIAVTNDGRYVLAAGFNDSALAVLARDRVTGILSFDRVVRDDADPSRVLGGAIDVAVAPDGRFVYVAAFTDDALTVLAPEPGAPALAMAAGAALALRGRRARARRRAIRRT